ncbi:A24 family peptidase [Rhodovulum marinum]|uniref:Prepilin peptidase CpaA n=1 Tax=Rhodovulum marinum TaxID=320662 RepID=A0A4R2PZZ3_9RHOB|nr:prepilin peptidase [Rhodovulum marinum]TCP41669.1 prepilin peptidase CpaA [Rhodovulum marinum]
MNQTDPSAGSDRRPRRPLLVLVAPALLAGLAALAATGLARLSLPAAFVFLPFALPVAIWVAWSDMKTMKIPNKAVFALVGVFAVVGLIALPLEAWAWRWAHLGVVLVIGFLMSTFGMVGAGDAKFAAAMAPFVALPDTGSFLALFAAVTLSALVTHRMVRRIGAVRRALPDWESWERRDFPMGLALAGALIFYLALSGTLGLIASST